ncbi:MAG: primosomal protein N' [Dongiaceae bacterium]
MTLSSLIQVALPRAAGPYLFDYAVPEGLKAELGQLVRVPFGAKEAIGVIWKLEGSNTVPGHKIKPIKEILDYPNFPPEFCNFLEWVAEYTLSPPGAIIKMALSVPAAFKTLKKIRKAPFVAPDYHFAPPPLSAAQEQAVEKLIATLDKGFSTTLLDGVTGSGKSEVYFHAIAKILDQGKSALVLLPEIALSAQWLHRFEARFGAQPTLWHSALTPAQRRDHWQAIAKGKARVVVGARSALFLPMPKLGLIIVDEEHEAAFKQEEQVRYHARDMAIVRAKQQNLPISLVSATPSLESYVNVQNHKYQLITLPSRHSGQAEPSMQLIDMRQEKIPADQFIGPTMRQALAENLEKGEQSLLFLNRRGYAPLTLCRACGYRLQCSACTAWMVQHHKSRRLVCHHCGHGMSLPPKCPSCTAEGKWHPCGPGVERLAEEVKEFLPNARIAIMASDELTNTKAVEEVIAKIEARAVDIVIGTQLVAKGHHFPHLTLVGVIDADLGLSGGDMRAAERSYQLLHQVAGRAGRAELPGRALIQSFQPDHPVMQALVAKGRNAFLAAEEAAREAFNLPPFGRLASVIVSGANQKQVESLSRDLARHAPALVGIDILGPAPAPLAKLRGRHRQRFLMKGPKARPLQPVIQQWLMRVKIPSSIKIAVDIDPYSFW